MRRNPHADEMIRLVIEERLAPIEIVQRIGTVTYSQVYNVIQRARREGKVPHITTWGRTTTSQQRFLEMTAKKSHIAVGRLGREMATMMDEKLIDKFVRWAAEDGYSSLAEAAVDIITDHMMEDEHGTEQGRSGNIKLAATAGRQGAGGGNQGHRPVGEAQGAVCADGLTGVRKPKAG